MGDYRNSEHYHDPTAAEAIESASRQERAKEACELMKAVSAILSKAGYAVDTLRIKHRETGQTFMHGRVRK